jgi:hypothetical protein
LSSTLDPHADFIYEGGNATGHGVVPAEAHGSFAANAQRQKRPSTPQAPARPQSQLSQLSRSPRCARSMRNSPNRTWRQDCRHAVAGGAGSQTVRAAEGLEGFGLFLPVFTDVALWLTLALGLGLIQMSVAK